MIFVAPKPIYYDIRGGDGVPVRKIGKWSYLLKSRRGSVRRSPWEVVVDVVTNRVYVGKGYVNSLEPILGGEPISGIYPDGTLSGQRPFLALNSGIKAVLLKITPNAAGRLDTSAPYLASEEALQVVLGDLEEAAIHDPERWIQPLALVSEGGRLMQLSTFNYSYKAVKRKGSWRHSLSAEPVFSRSIQDQLAAITRRAAS